MARKLIDNKKDFHADAVVDCAYAGCAIPAMCRIKTKTGLAAMCQKHYDNYFTDQAYDNLPNYGMEKLETETHAQWIGRMRLFFRKGFKQFNSKAAF